MTRITASAPGKVILSGEYAVLAGAPAMSMAINRRAVTTIDVLPGNTSCLCTPGLTDGEWRFDASVAGLPEWIDEPPREVALLIEAALTALGATLPVISITIDTRDFYDDVSGQKLGLGSSAAAMTSVIQALGRMTGHAQSVSETADLAHRRMQGGGSGVDVATSAFGGVICFARGDTTQVEPRQWPGKLNSAVLWSGKASKTPEMVGKLAGNCWSTTSGRALLEAAHAAAARWDAGSTATLAAMQNYADCLLRFGIDQKIGIFDAGHDRLFELAKTSGVVYKPSGAGGGDIGTVLARDDDRIRRFCADAERHGFEALDLALDPLGAECRELTGE